MRTYFVCSVYMKIFVGRLWWIVNGSCWIFFAIPYLVSSNTMQLLFPLPLVSVCRVRPCRQWQFSENDWRSRQVVRTEHSAVEIERTNYCWRTLMSTRHHPNNTQQQELKYHWDSCLTVARYEVLIVSRNWVSAANISYWCTSYQSSALICVVNV